MSVELPSTLSAEDNFDLLNEACMLLRAAEDILLNESSELFHLAYACENETVRRHALSRLDLLCVGVIRACSILKVLSQTERASWEA